MKFPAERNGDLSPTELPRVGFQITPTLYYNYFVPILLAGEIEVQ